MNSEHEQRRRGLIEKMSGYIVKFYDCNGVFQGPYSEPDERDRIWAAAILMEHGGQPEQQLAETLIRNAFGGPDHDYTKLSLAENLIDCRKAVTRDWNVFQSNDVIGMLARHRPRFSPDCREKMLRIARRALSRFAGDGQPDYLFQGANDNMPAACTLGLILGGELLGDEQGRQDGVYRLHLLAELLSRRGLCSEFGSGTYLPLTISAIAEIANLSTDPAIRELALKIERQLWGDAVGHYHPGSGKNGAPMTRSYFYNTIGHLDTLMATLWAVTGHPPFLDPLNALIPAAADQVTHFGGDYFKTATNTVVYAMTPFHFPTELQPLLDNRPEPFRFNATAEQFYGGLAEEVRDIGGRECVSTVYQTADYSLATSTHGFVTGNHSEKIRLCYRRTAAPQSIKDTGTLYARLLYHDDAPAQEGGVVVDRALVRTLQHDHTVLYVSRGHRHNITLPAVLRCIRQTVVLPTPYHDVASVWIGNRQLANAAGASAVAEPVFLDLGRLYLGLFPLALTNHGRQDLIRVEQSGKYRVISFFNYEGGARQFTAEALEETFNGFVAHVSGPAESGTFADFRRAWRLHLVEDWWYAVNRRTRIVFGDDELLLNWSTPSDTIRSATINGQEPPAEKFRATGLDNSCFPLLTQPYRPCPEVLPLDNLDCAWYPDARWQIGCRFATARPDR